MFERFTDPITIVRMIQAGDVVRLKRVVAAGAKIDRRTTFDPWMTPLDAAASTPNLAATEVLLAAGAPVLGSSIFEAIRRDAANVLKLYYQVDPKFHQRFGQDSNGSANPRLNRWLLIFTALDYAISINSPACASLLEEVGARRHPNTKPHRRGCTGVFIEEEAFLSFGGVNIDGMAEVTTGFYCAKCQHFVS